MTSYGGTNQQGQAAEDGRAPRARLTLRPERRLIRPSGSFRHIDFQIDVEHSPRNDRRPPVSIAIVIDRSGSMSGDKIQTAKQAALAVIDRLDERDTATVVVFDDQVDVVHPAGPVTTEFKSRVRAELQRIDARASTDLHRGWLTGCQEIASDQPQLRSGRLARCFLLTDGQANQGVTDPEQIATDAAGVWQNAGITTSTFGIGDYDESVLGPMAVAGGGQFHHLRTSREIATTFVGELAGLFDVAVSRVTLEIEADAGIEREIVSQYHSRALGASRWSIGIGDLIGGEQRHVVVRFAFPAQRGETSLGVRARLVYVADGEQLATDWLEVRFTYASHGACDAEPYDLDVMRWVARHHADRAQRDAVELNQRRELRAARQRIDRVARRIRQYAGNDPELRAIVHELEQIMPDVSAAMAPMAAKEVFYQAQRRSRGQQDRR